ncbi:hypothetical protein [Streptomyces sp. NPDC051662]|uniref:hypothetical protein n=1 Tax=Streptomyces sp. NPDC051662 TaxID=3154750 RepID=UPI00342A206F
MAEISFPFNAANSNGGTSVVSQTQWQQMAAAWGGDRIDFQLTNSNYSGTDLPFTLTVLNGRQVRVSAGSAWVGGFYYQLTGSKTFDIPENATTKGRKDLIAIRVDMSKSAVQMVLITGTSATSPKEPTPKRLIGGVWEMPIFAVDAPASNGAVTVTRRGPFHMPPSVGYPWSAAESVALSPRNSISYDLDSNSSGGQVEYWNGQEGYVAARHLGPSRTYTPSMVNSGSISSNYRNGRWRWIAPNLVWFSLRVENSTNTDVKKGATFAIGVTLPTTANARLGQVVLGHLDNDTAKAGGLPNFTSLSCRIHKGANTSNLFLYYPNPRFLSEGLDGLAVIPRKSTITISGVYEAAEFKE